MVKDSDVVNLQRTSVLFYPITCPASWSRLAVSSELHVDQSVYRYGQWEHIGVPSRFEWSRQAWQEKDLRYGQNDRASFVGWLPQPSAVGPVPH